MKRIAMSRTFLLFSFLLMTSAAMAQIPQLISYQGFLTDNDKAIADGDYSITVKIFDAATAGNELWTETLTVSTINGLFSTSLGAVTPFNLPFDQAYFLSTTFDGTELLPRTAMTASPYAFNSIQAGNPYALDNANGSAQEVVFVDADSKIGLGTNTPNTNVHIKSPSGVKNEIFIEPGNWSFGGDEAQITFGDSNHRITSTFGEGITFYDVDQFRFEGSSATILNRLGIGTEPSWRLHAQGATSEFHAYGDQDDFNGSNLVAGFVAKTAVGAVARFANEQSSAFVDIGTNGDGAFVVEHNDLEAFILASDGSATFKQRVGIGADSDPDPNTLLTVNGNIRVRDDSNIFGLDGLWGFNDLRFFGDPILDDPLTGGDMIIKADGKVGIGIFDPQTLLHVNGNITLRDDNSIFGLDGLWGFDDLRFFGDQNDIENGPDMMITADGNVGIGVDPVWRFQARGNTSEFRVYGDDDDNLNGTNLVAGFFAKNTAGAVARFASEQSSAFVDIGTNGNGAFVIEHDDQEAFILATDGNATFVGNITAANVTAPSDRRYKKNFTAIDQALNKVLQLDGLYYNWRVDEFPTKKFTTEQQMGFIAQDIEKLFPEMVHTDEAGYKSVNYGKLTPVLVEAIKEQQVQIDQLKAEKAAFQTELADLKANVMARLEALETQKDNSKNSASRTSKR